MKIHTASTFFSRLRGLMFRRDMADDEALLIERCNAIHTCFMRFNIDARFLDSNGNTVKEVKNIPPWRLCVFGGFKAAKVLETKSRAAALAGAIMLAGALSPLCAEPPPLRIAYNYCTLAYTFAYASDDDWSREIERLAKAGYNTALVVDGTFKVWQLTLRELGFTEEQISAFIPDECARPWWLMGNLYGEGAVVEYETIEDDARRGRFICEKMRSLGIEPILHGCTGMVPPGFPSAIPQGKWGPYERPPVINPTSPEYAHLARIWHRNLVRVYGFEPKFLAGDLFHEGGVNTNIDIAAATRAVQDMQQRDFPGVVWVIQAWHQNPTAEMRSALDPRFTLIEALVKDMSAFNLDTSICELDFGDLPWVWCEVLNFGGNFGLYGNLKTFARMTRAASGKGARTFRGYGALSEGFFSNPICSDLFEEMMMRDPQIGEMSLAELNEWIEAWVVRRYGFVDARAFEAWKILEETVYACPRSQEGTIENIMCAEPSFAVNSVSTWGPREGVWYDTKKIAKVLEIFSEILEDHPGSELLAHDLSCVKALSIANRARELVPFLKNDENSRNEFLSLFHEESKALKKVRELDFEQQILASRARAGNRGAVAYTRMVTTWAHPKYGTSTLADYSFREFPYLLENYYYSRWRKFLK